MKGLYELKDEDCIAIAKLVDNNFIGNKKIIVHPLKTGILKITGHTDGGQCINCEVKIDIYMNELKGIYTQNDDVHDTRESFRHVHPPTLKKVIDYLKENNFKYHL